MCDLKKGTFLTLADICKMYAVNEAEAAVTVAIMQGDGELGEYVEGFGYPVRYGK